MGSIALDWHKETNQCMKTLKICKQQRQKTPQLRFSASLWNTFSKRMQTLLETTDEESYL